MTQVHQEREPLSADEFRDAIGRFASGVTVITTMHDGHQFGATASAVSSLSLEPPMLLTCLSKESTTGQAIAVCGHFAVNILDDDHPDLAIHFASRADDKFDYVSATPGADGNPLLEGALATLECRVTETATGGTHWVFLAEVDHASARPGTPLAYFRGQFGRLHLEEDETAYRTIRSLILTRELGIDRSLDLDELSNELMIPRGAVYHALVKLASDRLVTRSESGFQVQAVTLEAVESALAARQTILVGLVARSIGNIDADQLDELRAKLREVTPATAEGELVPFQEWHQALIALQRSLLALGRSTVLTDAYAQADVAAMIAARAGGLRQTLEERWAHRANYEALVDALATGDFDAASDAIERIVDRTRKAAEAVFARRDRV